MEHVTKLSLRTCTMSQH